MQNFKIKQERTQNTKVQKQAGWVEGVWRSDIPSKPWVHSSGAGEHALDFDVGHRRLRPSGSWAEGPAAEAEPLQGPCWRTATMTEPLQGPCWRPATKGTSAAQELGQMQLSRRRGNFCSRGSGNDTGAGGKRPNHDRLCIEKRN